MCGVHRVWSKDRFELADSRGPVLAESKGVRTPAATTTDAPARSSAAQAAGGTLSVGRVLPGGYEIISLLGAGGMGSVYLARQHSLDRLVAVKMMHGPLSLRPQAVNRFLLEARAASRLSHPGAVTVYDFGQSEGGEMFLVMEYIDGPSLSELARDHKLSPLAAVDLVLEVLEALEEAHDYGVLHMDLKPDNVLVQQDRQGARHAKVVDFGLAKLLHDEAAPRTTEPGVTYGTPGFISPEELRGDRVDHRADLYAVGVMLHQLLTGRMPSDTAVTAQGGPPRTLTTLRRVDPAELPSAGLTELLLSATASNPEHRPVSARTFAEELRTIRQTLDVGPSDRRGVPPKEAERAPLLGRERELAMALDFALTSRPEGQFVALRGVLGSGRTRLLDEVAGAARAAGRVVVRVAPDPLGIGISGSALREVTRQLLGPRTPDANLARRSGRDVRGRAGERRSTRLVDAMARLLEGVAAISHGVLIAVDDFGEVDSLSRKVFIEVVERGLPADISMVVTSDAVHTKELACERTIRLEPLSGEALQRLHGGFGADDEAVPLAAVLGNRIDGPSDEADGSAWRVILRALRSLPGPAMLVLEAACVVGSGSFAVPPEELSAAVIALERSGLAIGTRPSHPLVSAVVRDGLSLDRRRELAAVALRGAVERGERPEVLAHHAMAAGDPFTALVHLERVASWRGQRGDRAGAVAALASAVDVVRAERARSDSQLPDADGALRHFTARLAVARAR